jgi:hypothetical protein
VGRVGVLHGSIQAGDVDGDGSADLIGRGHTDFARFATGADGRVESFLPYGYPPFATRPAERAATLTTGEEFAANCSPLPERSVGAPLRDGPRITLAELQAFDSCLQGAEGCNCEVRPAVRELHATGAKRCEQLTGRRCAIRFFRKRARRRMCSLCWAHPKYETSLFISGAPRGIVSDLQLHEAGNNPSGSFNLLGMLRTCSAAGSIAGLRPRRGAGFPLRGELMTSLIRGAVASTRSTPRTSNWRWSWELGERYREGRRQPELGAGDQDC